jgi:hypothetical protein
VITFDQALETPPWKSTASGMKELPSSGWDTAVHAVSQATAARSKQGLLGRSRQRTYGDGDVARRMSCPHGLGMGGPCDGWTGPTFDWNS